jgi:hypothetical protein
MAAVPLLVTSTLLASIVGIGAEDPGAGSSTITFEEPAALSLHAGGEHGNRVTYEHAPEPRGTSMAIAWDAKHHPWISAFVRPHVVLPGLSQARHGRVHARCFATGNEGIRGINLLLIDAAGERFQVHPPQGFALTAGWNDLVYEISPETMRESYGDKRNGIIDPPLQFFGFTVDFGQAETPPGTIWLDDIREEVASLAMVGVTVETGHPLHFVRPGEEETLRLRLANRSPESLALRCDIAIENQAGAGSATVHVLNLAPGASEELPLVLPEGSGLGAYWLRYALSQVPTDGTVPRNTGAGAPSPMGVPGRPAVPGDAVADAVRGERRFAVLIPAEPTPVRPDGFLFGNNSHPLRHPLAEQDLEIEALALSGAKVLRFGPPWQEFQKGPGAPIDFSGTDRVVDAALAKGIEVQFIIAFTPWWAARPEKRASGQFKDWGFSPPDLAALRHYATACAERYRGKIRFWEVWNEPDIEFFNGTAEEYLAMLQTCHEAIKAVDPALQVMTAGFADCGAHPNTKPGFHQRILAEGQDFFDIHAYHQHGFFPDFAATVDGPLKDMRQVLDPPKPLYFNETAMHSVGCSERIQADILVQKAVFCWSRGAIGHTWYDLRNDGTNPKDAEHNYGLLTQDFQPKPAYAAYVAMTRMLADKAFRRQLDLPSGQWAFSFGKPGDEVVVAWSQDTPGEVLTLATDATRAEIFDIMGNASPAPIHDGRVLFPFGNSPSYLRLTGGTVPPEQGKALIRMTAAALAMPGQAMDIGIELANPFPAARTVALTWHPPAAFGLAAQELAVPLAANETKAISLVDMVPADAASRFGETLAGSLVYTLPGTPFLGIYPVPMTMAARIPAGAFAATPTFRLRDRANVVNLFDFDPMNQHLLWQGPQDLSADLWLAIDGGILKVKAVVRDDAFSQKEKRETLWKGDSIQLGIAVPGKKGFWEFGLARLQGGPAVIPYATPEGLAAHPCRATVEIAPADDGLLAYQFAVPLDYLGLTREQAVSGFRFNLIVNDNDGQARESWLEIAPGIGKRKDPATFPQVFLAP